ncbi:molybdate ABC transporter substrate-binding protein [Shewanella oncorhynchi]|uniref:molybdate ABC transporter substrate-binding protein n=1 Tax=Shewanella TaxID=22 RepID=UPI001562FEF7|nr:MULTISPECIES: molybdate ABC transporter substrate-binding protein [unclassified Shewanella]MBI1676519.1 molybdate ABC transporter substrate-binding protein [Shewanella sp. DW31]MBW3516792.1 molybdate ABC transporter substrate-binding protein [Shewanella sp. NKUCC01_JLK]NRD33387.1 molybdate ABC transporter substrate-binding protein [Shewanella sp. DC2-4]
MISKNVLVALSLSPVIMVTAVQGVPMKAEVTTGAAPIELRAAGSLKAAMSDIIAAYQAQSQISVVAQYAPSGLLLKRIQEGEKVDIFASANMKHPQALVDSGQGEAVQMFARNQLCAVAQDTVQVTSATLLDTLLDPKVKVGTSTPKADPAGDYAWAVFAKAEVVKPNAKAALETKALQLTGGPESVKSPKDRNPYGWVMENKQADIFLTYCTNAVLAKKEVPSLQIIDLPQELAVGADYGLLVLQGANTVAKPLAEFILSTKGQAILSSYGFQPPAK